MHILSLILLCIYTPTVFSAANTRSSRRRKTTTTMSLGAYVAQVEHEKLLDCIKQHEASPCSNAFDFAVLKTHYEEAHEKTQPSNEKRKWQHLLTQCNTRMNIMLDIEAAEQIMSGDVDETIHATAMQEVHWQALRDTYQSDPEHYAFYSEKARLACDRYKEMILNRDISHLLSLPSISHGDYINLCERADTLFGDRADEILTQLPEVTKIAARSVATSLQKNATPSQPHKKRLIRGIKPNNQKPNNQKQIDLVRMRAQVTSYLNAKHLKSKARAAILVKLYKNIAANSSGIERLQATGSARHYEYLHRQISLTKEARQLKRSLYSVSDFHKLKRILTELRDTYATIDPNYDKTNYKISMVDRKLWYHLGNVNKLHEANSDDTNAARIRSTQTLIDRLERENYLADVLSIQSSLKEKRGAYIELLSIYNPDEPEHAIYLNKVLQYDLMIEIEQTDSPEVDDLTYFTENVRLRAQLAQTYGKDTPERTAVKQELKMHKALKIYTEAHNFALTRINQPITQDNDPIAKANAMHFLISDLYAFAQYVNKTYATSIKTDWMENRLAEYAQCITYYETVAELQTAEQSPVDSRSTQRDLLREIINSPITTPAAKKEYLIKLINLTDDLILKIRVIRDELLTGMLDTNEQIQWNKELAQHNLTRKIRCLRDKLKTDGMDHQFNLNKELSACYAQREALAHK